MGNKAVFMEVLKRNEDIYRKFFEIETEVLTILDFKALFERLISLIKAKFDVDHAWIALVRDGDLAAMLGDFDVSTDTCGHLVLVDRDITRDCLRNCKKPVLDNADLARFAPLMPAGLSPVPQSMALAPLTLDGHLVGCLVQGDADSGRFAPDMDATLLSQLAVKVSLCLSNVTAHERLARIASRDPLTGLLNRRVMEERLREEFLRSVRYHSTLSVAFVDMDDFKKVNDSLGHDAGDALLAYFAARLAKMAREIDICARFAGDEFVVILPNTDLEQARVFMQRVDRFFRISPVPGFDCHVRFSYGVSSTADAKAISPEALLKLADQELFGRKARKHVPDRKASGA